MRVPQRGSRRELILSIDVGGTKTRGGVALLDGDRILPHPAFSDSRERRLGSKGELAAFVRQMVKGLAPEGRPRRCVVSFAGPVISGSEVEITNWKGMPRIVASDLHGWGLPAGRTLMLNDMEAAAFGIVALVHQEALASPGCVPFFVPEGRSAPDPLEANRILLMPGTGFGTAGIVTVPRAEGGWSHRPVASEVQHSPVVPLDERHARLVQWLREAQGLPDGPSWEDFVSGQGLVRIHEGLRAIGRPAAGGHPPTAGADPAAAIAERAVGRTDPLSEEALDLFYRCAGRLAQIMALAYLPFGGIFLGGNSTVRNAPFIRTSRLIEELHKNARRRELLRRFPVYLVLEELNVRGGLWACKERIRPD